MPADLDERMAGMDARGPRGTNGGFGCLRALANAWRVWMPAGREAPATPSRRRVGVRVASLVTRPSWCGFAAVTTCATRGDWS
jgi:hypothetical protein